jgi:predicted solute-binding protein
VRLLIDDTLATAPFVVPLAEGWVTPAAGVVVEARAGLRGGEVAADDLALVASAEVALLGESHRVVPEVATVAGSVGAVAMRTPVRPDEVERGPVRLLGVSGTAEQLARATLRPFYGIEPTGWPRTEDDPAAAMAQAVIVEGAEALRPVEGGFAEDLCRAWLILTGTPVVTHVLVAPREAGRESIAPALATLAALRQAAHERRREWRPALGERLGVPLDRLYAFFAEQRLVLEADDRRALLLLLQRGGRGSAYPPVGEVRFLEAAGEG